MSPEVGLLLASIALILGNSFFVAAEYALVSARRSRIESLARKGNRTAKLLLQAIDDLSPYVAAVQICITMIGIGVGAVTEPFITGLLERYLGQVLPRSVGVIVSILIVTFFMVVIGELVPKYLSLQRADTVAFVTIRPLQWIKTFMKPLVWLVQASGALILKPFGIDISAESSDAVPKEELMMLVRAGGSEGTLEKTHAELVTRALRLDTLDAQDILIHRLDMKWIDVSTSRDDLLAKLSQIPFSRIPVCNGDIDEVIGILYIHDVVKNLGNPEFNLAGLVRPAVFIPESLSLEKILGTMRDEKTQMLIVMDEYGGTSGLVTLEDVVEEVFGELEDRIESERPPIECQGQRVSARADVRFDELVGRLNLNIEPDTTDTLAQIFVDALDRVPRPGDSVETKLGLMRVENMARRRITRVSIQLLPELSEPPRTE
ncbi:MAG TPA: hemolysin family protein [Fimbriimonas sp.]